MWSRGAGHGVYGEATITLPLHGGLGMIVSGGRYPTDPVRGTIAGRYVSAGLRVSGVSARRPAPPTPAPARPHYGSNGGFAAPVPAVEVDLADGVRTAARHRGPHGSWSAMSRLLPVPLTPGSGDRWALAVPLPPGVRRLAIRVDGGPWLAPAGTRRVFDEFGGEVGLLIVP
jgi:hypothetical protein